jgi:hypothetical protein
MAKKLSPFEEAFKAARDSGEKTFPFNGKLYGTVTADDEQKRIDKIGSVSRQSGPVTTTQGATYPKSQVSEKSLLDKYRESDMAKGFRDARATFGDTPSTDMLMKAGQLGIAAMPVGRALSAANKYLSKKDNPAASVADDIKDPSFNPEKMMGRDRSEATLNLEKMMGRDRPEPGFKKGGKVSSASSRGDGIAQRGKTRGKMC